MSLEHLRIVEANNRLDIVGIERIWCTLQEQCVTLTPFQTWEWNVAWWRHFGAHRHLYLLLFYADADLVGIAPLFTGNYMGSPVRRLAWVGTGNSDYLGPVARTGYEERVAEALRVHLSARHSDHATSGAGWDFADLQQMRPDAPLLHKFGRSSDLILATEACPYVSLPDNWKAFTAGLGKSLRTNLGYYDRLLHRTFADARYHLAEPETLEEGLTALFLLHQRRWNGRRLPGVLGGARVQAFHRDVSRSFLAKGWLRLHLLTIDGTIQAALYCFALNGSTFYYLGGFAPERARHSLGTLLTARAIRLAIEEGCMEFDFLRGEEPYKARWQPASRMNYRLLLRRTWSDSPSSQSVGFWQGAAEWPGRAGFALNRVERYLVRCAKSFAARRSGARSGTCTRQS